MLFWHMGSYRTDKETCLQVCDTAAELAAEVSAANGWPELLPFIFQLVQSQDAQVGPVIQPA